MSSRVTIGDIRAAAARIAPWVHRTPLFSSRRIGEEMGVELWLKAEVFQKTGSFKPRGAVNRLLTLDEDARSAGLVTVSAGNHAQGLAYAAGSLEIDCVVVMPESAPRAKVEASRDYGAEVILHGTVSDAFALALEMAEAGRFLAHPYDDLAVIAGQGTVGLEVTEDVEAADVVVVPIGGGGLISGVATAVKAAWPSARVVGVEPLGAQTMTRALADGEPSAIEPDTIADGLSAPIAGVYTLAHTRALVDEIVVIGDEQIAAGMRSLAGAAKLVTEASGAAAVAALMAGAVPVGAGERVVAVCSGGNIDLDRFAALVDS